MRKETKDGKQVWGRGDRVYDLCFDRDNFELPGGPISENSN